MRFIVFIVGLFVFAASAYSSIGRNQYLSSNDHIYLAKLERLLWSDKVSDKDIALIFEVQQSQNSRVLFLSRIAAAIIVHSIGDSSLKKLSLLEDSSIKKINMLESIIARPGNEVRANVFESCKIDYAEVQDLDSIYKNSIATLILIKRLRLAKIKMLATSGDCNFETNLLIELAHAGQDESVDKIIKYIIESKEPERTASLVRILQTYPTYYEKKILGLLEDKIAWEALSLNAKSALLQSVMQYSFVDRDYGDKVLVIAGELSSRDETQVGYIAGNIVKTIKHTRANINLLK